MAKHVITRTKVWLDGYDIAGQLNAVAIDNGREEVDVTSLDDTTRLFVPGVHVVRAQVEGFHEAGVDKIDPVLFDRLSLADAIFTVGPVPGAAEGTRAFFFKASTAQYTPAQGAVGEARRISASAENGSGRLVRGTILHNATQAATGGPGTARQLGAIATGKRLYAAVHLLAISGGGTLTPQVVSDNAQGMGSPTVRIPFTGMSAKGAQWAELAGPVTDDWWAVSWSLTGTTPSATFVVVAGIL